MGLFSKDVGIDLGTANTLENPRLCSNESPSGAFKRQSGLR